LQGPATTTRIANIEDDKRAPAKLNREATGPTMLDAYRNFDLHLFDHRPAVDGTGSLRVLVLHSPAGSQLDAEVVNIPSTLAQVLADLAAGALDGKDADLIVVGRVLATLMFPPKALQRLHASYAGLGPNEGLRLRLSCTGETLSAYPWEMAHCALDSQHNHVDAGAYADARGFLVLNSTISLVRLQPGSRRGTALRTAQQRRRVVSLMSDPPSARLANQEPLGLDQELEKLRSTLAANDSFEPLANAVPTRLGLQEALMGGAHCFHFAGHGGVRDVAGRSETYLMLETAEGQAEEYPVDKLVLDLANNGIQLAVLGACHSAARGGRSAYASIAPSLVRAGIPVVLGMQYDVLDNSALAFSNRLYCAWTGSMLVDEAVSRARLAIHATEQTGRDFATPVLYVQEDATPEWPSVTNRRDDAARAPVPGIEPVRHQMDEIEGYKRVHSALHTTKRNVQQMRLLCDRPAEQQAASAFKTHAVLLRGQLHKIQNVVRAGQCNADQLTEVAQEFKQALDDLNTYAPQSAWETLGAVVTAIESLLARELPRMDGAMKSVFEQIRFDAVTQSLALPQPAADAQALNQSAHDRHAVERDLRHHVRLHHKCQRIDSTLTSIRREESDKKMVIALAYHWKKLHPALLEVQSDPTSTTSDRVWLNMDKLNCGVTDQDPDAMIAAFQDFCVDFDFEFERVDIDVEQLCRDIRDPAHPKHVLYAPAARH
jgi:hypothetical protein